MYHNLICYYLVRLPTPWKALPWQKQSVSAMGRVTFAHQQPKNNNLWTRVTVPYHGQTMRNITGATICEHIFTIKFRLASWGHLKFKNLTMSQLYQFLRRLFQVMNPTTADLLHDLPPAAPASNWSNHNIDHPHPSATYNIKDRPWSLLNTTPGLVTATPTAHHYGKLLPL